MRRKTSFDRQAANFAAHAFNHASFIRLGGETIFVEGRNEIIRRCGPGFVRETPCIIKIPSIRGQITICPFPCFLSNLPVLHVKDYTSCYLLLLGQLLFTISLDHRNHMALQGVSSNTKVAVRQKNSLLNTKLAR